MIYKWCVRALSYACKCVLYITYGLSFTWNSSLNICWDFLRCVLIFGGSCSLTWFFYDFDYFEKSSDYVSMYASMSTIWRKKPSMKFETFIPLKRVSFHLIRSTCLDMIEISFFSWAIFCNCSFLMYFRINFNMKERHLYRNFYRNGNFFSFTRKVIFNCRKCCCICVNSYSADHRCVFDPVATVLNYNSKTSLRNSIRKCQQSKDNNKTGSLQRKRVTRLIRKDFKPFDSSHSRFFKLQRLDLFQQFQPINSTVFYLKYIKYHNEAHQFEMHIHCSFIP